MTVKDIAQHIGCSPQLIRSAAQRGAIDYVTYIPPRRKYGYGRYIVYPEKAKAALGIKEGLEYERDIHEEVDTDDTGDK